MVKVFKEKEQQALSFDLLMVYYRQLLEESVSTQQAKSNGRAGGTVGANFESTPKWTANVSWQNVCEQLVIQMIHPKS